MVYAVLPSDCEQYNTKGWVLPDRLLPNDSGSGDGTINSWTELVSEKPKSDDSDGSDDSDSSSESNDSGDDEDDDGDEHGRDDSEGNGDDQMTVAPEDLPENWF